MHYNLFLADDRHVQVFAFVDAGKTRAEAAEELGIEQELEPSRPDDWFLPCGAARQARRAVPTTPVVSGSVITKAFTTHGATR